MQIACWRAAPALATGNAMIFEPAELTPLTTPHLAQIFKEAGQARLSRFSLGLPGQKNHGIRDQVREAIFAQSKNAPEDLGGVFSQQRRGDRCRQRCARKP